MRIVATEEHVLPLAMRNAWSALDPQYQDDGFRGWHFEAGIQLLRLVVAGAFDRHPGSTDRPSAAA